MRKILITYLKKILSNEIMVLISNLKVQMFHLMNFFKNSLIYRTKVLITHAPRQVPRKSNKWKISSTLTLWCLDINLPLCKSFLKNIVKKSLQNLPLLFKLSCMMLNNRELYSVSADKLRPRATKNQLI